VYFSFSHAINQRTPEKLRARIAAVPDDRLLIESDQVCAGAGVARRAAAAAAACTLGRAAAAALACGGGPCACARALLVLLAVTAALCSRPGVAHTAQVTPLVIDAGLMNICTIVADVKGWSMQEAAQRLAANFTAFYAQQLASQAG
jgi:Tat protein secretion system quality control protein TatD with DNase activity